MKKLLVVLFFFSFLTSIFAIDYKGESKNFVIKNLGTPNRIILSSDGKSEYDLWIENDKVWTVCIKDDQAISDIGEVGDLLQFFLDLGTISTNSFQTESESLTPQSVEEKTDILEDEEALKKKVEMTVLNCKKITSWGSEEELGYQLKFKNRSDKTITKIKVISYFYDKDGICFFEKEHTEKFDSPLKPNYSILSPKTSNSYYTVSGIDLAEWDEGKADFIIESIEYE